MVEMRMIPWRKDHTTESYTHCLTESYTHCLTESHTHCLTESYIHCLCSINTVTVCVQTFIITFVNNSVIIINI